LTEDYISRLVEGIWSSTPLVEYKWLGYVPSSPIAGIMCIPRLIRAILSRKGIHRRIFIADLRARLRARGIILQLEKKKRKTAGSQSSASFAKDGRSPA
jgi:hypothetical protein